MTDESTEDRARAALDEIVRTHTCVPKSLLVEIYVRGERAGAIRELDRIETSSVRGGIPLQAVIQRERLRLRAEGD